jgi:squalene cyclase
MMQVAWTIGYDWRVAKTASCATSGNCHRIALAAIHSLVPPTGYNGTVARLSNRLLSDGDSTPEDMPAVQRHESRAGLEPGSEDVGVEQNRADHHSWIARTNTALLLIGEVRNLE